MERVYMTDNETNEANPIWRSHPFFPGYWRGEEGKEARNSEIFRLQYGIWLVGETFSNSAGGEGGGGPCFPAGGGVVPFTTSKVVFVYSTSNWIRVIAAKIIL